MKKMTAVATAFLLTTGLSGCTPGHNVGGATFVGAASGGLLGAALFHGHGAWIGVLGSALIGGVIGNFVGQRMDEQDRINMANAVTQTPVGQEATWTNSHHVTYTVRPTKQYHSHKRYCREYQTTVTIGGKMKKAFGTACRMPDGQWKIVK